MNNLFLSMVVMVLVQLVTWLMHAVEETTPSLTVGTEPKRRW